MNFENVFDLEEDFKVIVVTEKTLKSGTAAQKEEDLENEPASFIKEEGTHEV